MDNFALVARLRSRLAELTGDIASVEAARRAPLDADFAEQAAELQGQDALGGIEEAKLHEVAEIHAALARLESGSYGLCSVCGADIPARRLAALPTATTCIAHAPG
jgi:RNA polymerase-binding transcription factor DksA